MILWLLPVCLLFAVLAAASSRVPLWAPWAVPAGLAVLFIVAWRRESGTAGDSQPGLVAFIGAVAVVFVIVGILVGYAIRARGSRSLR